MLLSKINCTLYRICNLEYRYKKHLEEKRPLETFKHSNNAAFCLRPKDIITFPMVFSFEIIRNQGPCMVLEKLAIIALLPGQPFGCPSLRHTFRCLPWEKLFSNIWVLSVSTHQYRQKPHQEWVQRSWGLTSPLGNPNVSNFYTEKNGMEGQSVTPTVSNFPTEKLPIVVEWFRGTESDTESSSFFFFLNSPMLMWVETTVQG